jgi:RNA polymerase sigma factor (sigma-70 family)
LWLRAGEKLFHESWRPAGGSPEGGADAVGKNSGSSVRKMSWAALRELLVDHYDDFRRRLTRRLGSEELATESLQEAWLHLNRYDDIGPVRHPAAYVMRVASNIAADRRRAEGRRARRSDVDAALELADPAPSPESEVAARLELAALGRAIDQLPQRAREILLAARLKGQSQQEIADRFGISTRMVRIELCRALDYCEAQLKIDFLSLRPESSVEEHDTSVSVPEPIRGDAKR